MRATNVHTQALETARSSDLLFWASRYNLFVLWSADHTHPWDALPGAASHTTLEIGKLRGSERDVRSTACLSRGIFSVTVLRPMQRLLVPVEVLLSAMHQHFEHPQLCSSPALTAAAFYAVAQAGIREQYR